MKKLLTVSLFLLFSIILMSQTFVDTEADSIINTSYNIDRENYANTNLYLEGSMLIQSLNFESNLYRSESNLFQLYGRFGLGIFYFDLLDETPSVGGLAGLTVLSGRKNNHFETSLGAFVGSDEGPNVFFWPIATLGYRYQKPEGNFIFRISIGTLDIVIGLGYAF